MLSWSWAVSVRCRCCCRCRGAGGGGGGGGGGRPGCGVDGVVGVDGAFGVEEGLEQFAALEVEVASGDAAAAAVVLQAQPQAAVLVGSFGAVLEFLLRQQGVEQQAEGAGRPARLPREVASTSERVGEPVELAARASGDALEPVEQVGEQGVVVVEAAAGLADGGEHSVDDDRGECVFAGFGRR